MAPLNKWVSLGSAQGAQNSDSTSTSYSAGKAFFTKLNFIYQSFSTEARPLQVGK